jgi:transcriptional regulator with XRE-family HTH domain
MKTFEELLQARKLSIANAAQKLGLSWTTVWRWNKGVGGPSARQLLNLAKLLRVPPSALLDSLEKAQAENSQKESA